MKKLLLFIVILFGILSVQSFAWNYGCGENIPPEVCGAGGNGNTGVSYIQYHGAIAVNTDTGYWASISSVTDAKKAKNAVLSNCGENCKYIRVSADFCTAVSYSSIDKILTHHDLAPSMFVKPNNERRAIAAKKSLEKCQKKGGKNCQVLVSICSNDR